MVFVVRRFHGHMDFADFIMCRMGELYVVIDCRKKMPIFGAPDMSSASKVLAEQVQKIGGGTVYMPPGTFEANAQIVVPAGTVLDASMTTIVVKGSVGILLEEDAEIRNAKIVGTGNNTLIVAKDRAIIRNCWLENAAVGIDVQGQLVHVVDVKMKNITEKLKLTSGNWFGQYIEIS